MPTHGTGRATWSNKSNRHRRSLLFNGRVRRRPEAIGNTDPDSAGSGFEPLTGAIYISGSTRKREPVGDRLFQPSVTASVIPVGISRV